MTAERLDRPPTSALSRRKRGWIVAVAAAYVLATLWQVFSKRDDWPLSAFAMYSQPKVNSAARRVMVGVTEAGEFDVTLGAGLLNLRHSDRLVSASQSAQYLAQVVKLSPSLAQHRDLQAVRVYTETWIVQQRLEGIAHPQRTLVRSHYVAPAHLLLELRAQQGGAEPLTALPLPAGDRLFDLNADACSNCDSLADPWAGSENAVWLSAATQHDAAGRLELDVELPAGHWRLFVRTRLNPKQNSLPLLSIEGPDGADVYEFGHSWESLPYDAWVWTSAPLGAPPIEIEVLSATAYHLVFEANDGELSLDQVWFSRKQRELPASTHPREP